MTANDVELLLVEDNPDDVELTLLALQEDRIINRVKVVQDGVEALDFIFGTGQYEGRDTNRRPNLILLDLKLPKIDGIQVLEKLKSNEQTHKIPVVILTSSREESDVERCYDLGANSYIVKPVEFDQFRHVIKNLGYYWQILNESPQ